MSWPALIEQWFPTAAVGAESLRERGAASALPPVNFLHVWWARRPLITSRAAVLASILPAWPTDDDQSDAAVRVRAGLAGFTTEEEYRQWFLKVLGIAGDPVEGRKRIADARAAGKVMKANPYGYPRAFTTTPSDEDMTQVRQLAALRAGVSVESPLASLDQFAGGGSIPFEAARMGLDSIANELNPVACAILEGTVSLPVQHGASLLPLLEKYGRRWCGLVKEELSSFFPRLAEDEEMDYVWAHTIPCPKTKHPTPLSPNFWLARTDGRKIAVELTADSATGVVTRAIVDGATAAAAGDRSTFSNGTGTSIWDSTARFTSDDVRAAAKRGEVGHMLLAVVSISPETSGRQFRAPTPNDEVAVIAAAGELAKRLPAWELVDRIPTEDIYVGSKTNEPRKIGMLRWRDMFTTRQLLTHGVIAETYEKVLEEATADEDVSPDQVKALALYLAFAADKALDYNSRLASWDPTRLKVRNTFDRHDFSIKWSYAEFDGSHSLLPWAMSQVVDAYSKIAELATGERGDATSHPTIPGIVQHRTPKSTVYLGSATTMTALGDNTVSTAVTDPPYYDNVMYGECSDFFYVWLKRKLRSHWPQFTTLVVSDKNQEAVANDSLFTAVATHAGRGKRQPGSKTAKELATEHCEQLLLASFRETRRVLVEDAVFTVMFTHKNPTAWTALASALMTAGFQVTGAWPVSTESEHSLHQVNKDSAQATVMIACRPRPATATPGYWASLKREVQVEADAAVRRFKQDGLTGADLIIAAYGPALAVISKHWPLYDAETDEQGRSLPLSPARALSEAAVVVRRCLLDPSMAGNTAFDDVTDLWLWSWRQAGPSRELRADDIRGAARIYGVSVDDLVKRRLLRKSGSNVVLLTPAERAAAGRTQRKHHVDDLVDLAHALSTGIKAADDLWKKRELADKHELRDLLAAALQAIPASNTSGVPTSEAELFEKVRARYFSDMPRGGRQSTTPTLGQP